MTPESGSVIAYNAAFEKSCIEELAKAFPDSMQGLRKIVDRIVDLLPVTRAHWYHRDQLGSWSIKAVLPTIAPDLSYQNLHVAIGLQAQEAFIEAIDRGTTDERRAEIGAALKAYCSQDTLAMITIAERLIRQGASLRSR